MQMPINSRMDWLWTIHTMEYYMAMRISDLQLCATIQMNLTNTMLNKRRQTKKKKECRAQSSQSLELLETDIKQIPTQVNI